MKALLVIALIAFGSVFTATASGNNNMLVTERANHLSDQMIRELRLNNYQANEVREINTAIAAKMAAIETEFAGDKEAINQKLKTVLAERDAQLESVLSTVQYNNYFGKRTTFNKIDKEFAAKSVETDQDAVSLN